MKQIISKLFSRVAAVAAVALLTAATAWGETVQLTQSNLGLTSSYTTNTQKTIDGITYVYTDLMKNSNNIQAKANTGVIYNSTAFPGDITSVAITHSDTARPTTILGSSDGTNWTQVTTGSGSITGDFSGKGFKYFKITRGSNAAYWTKIEIAYSTSSSVPTTTTINSSGITNTDVYSSTVAGSLSATVKDNNNNVISGATVSWSGNNDEVATIDANTGSVTLVSAGTVTFTATYAGVSGQYAGSSATYQMTVTNSAPYVQPTVIEITPNYTFWGKTAQFSGNDYSELSGSKDNVTLAWSKGAGSTYANTNAMRFYKDNELTFTAPTGYEIKSILIAGENLPSDLGFSPEGFVTETLTWSGSSSTVTMSRPSNASSYVTISKYTITIGLPSTDPTINADDVDIAYNATTGIIEFSIGNEPSPAGTLTASSESDWLTVGTVGANVPFTCTENNTASERTATVSLSYSYGDNESVTKEVTVTQARNPNVVPTISEVRAQGTGTAVTKGVVTTITGSGNKTAYIQDATAAIVVYGNFSASVGDEIRVSGTLSTYKGLLEFTDPTVDVLSNDNTVTPTVMSIAEINGSTNQGWYVKIEDATVTEIDGQDTTISQGENTILVHGISGVEYGVNDIITLEGNIGCYNTVQIANPTNVTVQEVTTPTIVVSPNVKNLTAALSEGTLDIVYENLPIADMDDFEIVFYEEVGGNTIGSAPDWIEVLVAEQDPNVGEGYVVSYSVSENEGDARSVSFQLYALDEEETEVYSNFVTINQAAPVRDYATLPFAFDGGKSEIETTNGLTQEGLGSDYSASPKLKFDNTGDWVILRIDEAPGVLAFVIKGNSFSGGTFTVQTSVNGVTYTDLATYTDLGSSQSEAEFNDLDESVRYIKWIYTQKVSGNVALGNITLSRKAAAPDTYDRNLTAGDGGYWGTFYNGVADYQLPEGAQAFTMNVNKQFYRLGSNGRVIPAGTAVVIIADVEAVTLTKGGSPEPVAPNGGDNILLGDDFPVEGDGTQYVLGKKNNVIGFYKFQGPEIPANRAYYVVSE